MIYVVSDIHGNYEKWRALLDIIKLTSADTLYVLGDTVDRGPHGIKILCEMMYRPNVVHLLGNHEQMLMDALPSLLDNAGGADYSAAVTTCVMNGGDVTIDELLGLDPIAREEVRDYILDMPVYAEVEVNGAPFVLVHAGIGNFSSDKPLSRYSMYDLIWKRPDLGKRYYTDKTVVVGHTPTCALRASLGLPESDEIFMGDGLVGIDCGCGHGALLGCVCLDTMECVYV